MKEQKLRLIYNYWNAEGTKGVASMDFTYDELKEYKFENLMCLEEFIAKSKGHDSVKTVSQGIVEV